MDRAAVPQPDTEVRRACGRNVRLPPHPPSDLLLLLPTGQIQEDVNPGRKRGDGGHGGQTLCREQSREREMIWGGVGVRERPRKQHSTPDPQSPEATIISIFSGNHPEIVYAYTSFKCICPPIFYANSGKLFPCLLHTPALAF